MKKTFGLVVMVFAALMFVSACSSSDNGSKAPVYPACESNDNCASHGEFCVDGQCVECGTCNHCKDKGTCMTCKGNKCVAKDNCCTTDRDCTGGKKCKARPGKKEGTCM